MTMPFSCFTFFKCSQFSTVSQCHHIFGVEIIWKQSWFNQFMPSGIVQPVYFKNVLWQETLSISEAVSGLMADPFLWVADPGKNQGVAWCRFLGKVRPTQTLNGCPMALFITVGVLTPSVLAKFIIWPSYHHGHLLIPNSQLAHSSPPLPCNYCPVNENVDSWKWDYASEEILILQNV